MAQLLLSFICVLFSHSDFLFQIFFFVYLMWEGENRNGNHSLLEIFWAELIAACLVPWSQILGYLAMVSDLFEKTFRVSRQRSKNEVWCEVNKWFDFLFLFVSVPSCFLVTLYVIISTTQQSCPTLTHILIAPQIPLFCPKDRDEEWN